MHEHTAKEMVLCTSTAAIATSSTTNQEAAAHHLCQVVGTEAEEFSGLSQVTSAQCTAGHLNHGAHLVVNLGACGIGNNSSTAA
jgi:hypothetical protein